MRPSYLTRRLLTAALTANAVRPLRGRRTAVPVFAAGWLTSELAPQLALASALDVAQHTLRGRRGSLGTLLGLGSLGALAWMTYGAERSGTLVESTLRDGLGPDYQDLLESPPSVSELATSWRALAHPFRMDPPDGVEVVRDINYTAGGRRARLDVYRPSGADVSGAPVLVQVHGGAWTLGRKEDQGLLLMHRLAAAGWVCVAVNYRLAPKHPFPAQIVDVKKALAWVHEHIASYGGDPAYVAITGGSAGGHLAALAALTPGDPEFQPGFEDADTSTVACVPFYGVYDLAGSLDEPHSVGMRDYFLAPKVFLKDPVTDLEAFEKASPLLRITADAPDFLVLHGSLDSLVDVSQARAFVGRLKETSKKSVTYAELPGAQHAFEVFSSVRSQHVVKAAARWLQWHRASWLRTRES